MGSFFSSVLWAYSNRPREKAQLAIENIVKQLGNRENVVIYFDGEAPRYSPVPPAINLNESDLNQVTAAWNYLVAHNPLFAQYQGIQPALPPAQEVVHLGHLEQAHPPEALLSQIEALAMNAILKAMRVV
ncbi:hypothetical protein DFQ27_008428 [Actinomortierella ambigua]|uniref:Uncharacterized protein n=1 Tax=Actinomortierella ambigua TaxID=1343610 RepID=A0A9P6PSB4_9FUNG|nr:hypothetical protein DFQ27_008428 [Actinomortierella ambigua]